MKNRPDDLCVNPAICAKPSMVHSVEAGGATAGIYEFMPASFIKSWYDGVDVTTLPTIQCLPLSSIFAKVGIDSIDFWSLDVEGGELEVLRTVDFERIKVGVLVVEADGHSPFKNQQVRDLMLSKGFKYHGPVGNNDWFLGPTFVPLVKSENSLNSSEDNLFPTEDNLKPKIEMTNASIIRGSKVHIRNPRWKSRQIVGIEDSTG